MTTPKTVFITGASSGIGAATAVAAAAAGYDVAIGYHTNQAGAEKTAAAVRACDQNAVLINGDVADPDAVRDMFNRIDDSFDELGALVNNAGIADIAERVEDMSYARIRRMFDINAIGPFLCSRQAVLRMSRRFGGAGGVIVNVSCIAARLGSANVHVDYAAAKGALDVLTKGLGEELASDGIRVVGVRPGIIDTGIHAKGGQFGRIKALAPNLPLGRAGTVNEVADTILYLLSAKASYISATSIDIAGAR